MRTRKNFINIYEFLPILLVTSVSIYHILYFLLYEYGAPGPAISIHEFKKENGGRSRYPYVFPIHTLPYSDYNRLIDLNFSFSTLNTNCDQEKPFLLIVVYSAPENFAKRKILRETWGAQNIDVVLLFALGKTMDLELDTKISEENRIYQDMLQGSFLDTYKNLTYKHVMMLKFLIYHCPQAIYLLKADDDIYVNLPALLNFLKDVSVTGARNFLFCPPNYVKVVRSFRCYNSKWRLSFREYPNKNYPPSCNGFFFVYSRDIAFELYREAQKAKYFWIEDVHITGHMFKKLGLDHVNARPFMINRAIIAGIMNGGILELWPFLFAGPDLKEVEIVWLHQFVLNRTNVLYP